MWKTGDSPAENVVRDLKDMSCDVRLKELGFNLAKRKMRRDLFGIQSDLKDTYKGDGAKFFLVIADVVRRDNIHKLQTGRFQLDIKKTENVPGDGAALEHVT